MRKERSNIIGKPVDRVDGLFKVTGGAQYAADFKIENVAHAVLVMSTIAKGRIRSIDTRAALGAPGVFAVITHLNAPRLRTIEPKQREGTAPKVGEYLRPLQSDVIRFNGQPIAVVVASTLEQAEYAATLVRASYAQQKHATRVEDELARAFPPKEGEKDERTGRNADRPNDNLRGNPNTFAQAAVRVDNSYAIPIEHHNPMEPHATIAVWDGPRLTLYDKSQWVGNVSQHVALTFGMPEENVHVISHFVGGAFGTSLRTWEHPIIAAIAAQAVKRPVKLVLTRQQMFTITGYRPYTVQRVALGANRDGQLTAIVHEGTAQTSQYEEYTESLLNATRLLYASANLLTKYRLVRTDTSTPLYMRGPGEASGVYALECAMDELAYALKIDPIELRLRNHADVNPHDNLPWSSKSLKECYRQGAERFKWAQRNPKPRSMRDGRYLIGMGMASSTYPMNRNPASATVRLLADGTALVQSAASDMGPGTYTTMTIIAADALGLPMERVRFELGDSTMPAVPPHGGSQTAASVGSAVREACVAARSRVLALVREDERSPLRGATEEQTVVGNGRIFLRDDSSQSETYADILQRHNTNQIEATVDSKPGDEKKRFSMHAFGAHFVEVGVDEDLGELRVRRVVTAAGAGRIINEKTARSQAIGGIVGGLGMALMEETVMDHRMGRFVNRNLAEYHVPVNADVPSVEAFFVEERDEHVNPLGAKGVGEIAIVGVAAAVANAVYHATGKRIRDLPITADKLL